MSSPSPTASVPVTNPAPAAVPRKRRRRAPATGAADDCFTCRKKGLKCDRRRPYCSQCLDHGKECSGYKTQLTWGVGVASRGKLRGLSLPVARKPSTGGTSTSPKGTTTSTSPSTTPASGAPGTTRSHSLSGGVGNITTTVLTTPPKAVPTMKHRISMPPTTPARKAPATMANIMTYDFVNMDPTGSPPMTDLHSPAIHSPGLSSPQYSWLPAGYQRSSLSTPTKPVTGPSFFDQSAFRFDTPVASPLGSEFDLSTSAGSISGFSDGELHSPMDFPPTPEDMTFMPSPFSYYTPPPQAQSVPMWAPARTPSYRRAPTSYPDMYPSGSSMCSSLSSNPSQYEPVEETTYPTEPIGPCNLSDILYDDGVSGGGVPTSNDIELGFGYRMVRRPSPEGPFLFDI